MNFVCIVFEICDKMLTLSSMENLIVQCNHTLLLHSFTDLKVSACRYILQITKIHFLQYPKEYLILCV